MKKCINCGCVCESEEYKNCKNCGGCICNKCYEQSHGYCNDCSDINLYLNKETLSTPLNELVDESIELIKNKQYKKALKMLTPISKAFKESPYSCETTAGAFLSETSSITTKYRRKRRGNAIWHTDIQMK